MIRGGIDLGGTKIEARLFDGADAATVEVRRVPTPRDYPALLDALAEQVAWLTDLSGAPDMAIGIAVPGIVVPATGKIFAANVAASGHAVGTDLGARLGRPVAVVNDCMAFALSEANGGAGAGAASVMGLVLGTGVGGGFCLGGALVPRLGGVAVEIGHVALPASALARHDLPLLPCGCGRLGCMETYVSGTGLANLAERRLGTRMGAEALVTGKHEDILSTWADIAGECLLTIQFMLAPDIIVLGGGLSNLPGIVARLDGGLRAHALPDMALPRLALARHGDSSGARGAALLACAT